MRRRFLFLFVQRLAPAVTAVGVARRLLRDIARRIGTSAALWAPEHPVEEVVAATTVASAAATIHADVVTLLNGLAEKKLLDLG